MKKSGAGAPKINYFGSATLILSAFYLMYNLNWKQKIPVVVVRFVGRWRSLRL